MQLSIARFVKDDQSLNVLIFWEKTGQILEIIILIMRQKLILPRFRIPFPIVFSAGDQLMTPLAIGALRIDFRVDISSTRTAGCLLLRHREANEERVMIVLEPF
jgi:hypothetical protein